MNAHYVIIVCADAKLALLTGAKNYHNIFVSAGQTFYSLSRRRSNAISITYLLVNNCVRRAQRIRCDKINRHAQDEPFCLRRDSGQTRGVATAGIHMEMVMDPSN